MSYEFDSGAQARLEQYFEEVGDVLGNKRRRASFAMYATGILGDGERKSAEPIAARASADPATVRNAHEQLLHFLGRSEWEDAPIRRLATRHALAPMTAHEQVEAWIIDDTGFLKQGTHSPGVQRQYTGSAGKTTNCQLAVSLTVCTATMELPVDMDLYLPKSWIDDFPRRRAAKIPDSIGFRPKWKMALEMMKRAVEAGVPKGLVLTDAAYGTNAEFRDGATDLGFEYAVDVQSPTSVRPVSANLGGRQSVLELARNLPSKCYRKVTWRQGSRRSLASRFAMVRVWVEPSDGKRHPPEWLLIEWPLDETAPTHFVLSTLPPTTKRKQLVRRVKQRWRIERTYEDMKGELGLDHFEGRSYPGWHHHVTVVLACYAFVASERARSFPPSAARPGRARTLRLAA